MERQVRLVCYEDQFEALLADLALHKLDVVLTDREVRAGSALKVFSHLLFESEMHGGGRAGAGRALPRRFPRQPERRALPAADT